MPKNEWPTYLDALLGGVSTSTGKATLASASSTSADSSASSVKAKVAEGTLSPTKKIDISKFPLGDEQQQAFDEAIFDENKEKFDELKDKVDFYFKASDGTTILYSAILAEDTYFLKELLKTEQGKLIAKAQLSTLMNDAVRADDYNIERLNILAELGAELVTRDTDGRILDTAEDNVFVDFADLHWDDGYFGNQQDFYEALIRIGIQTNYPFEILNFNLESTERYKDSFGYCCYNVCHDLSRELSINSDTSNKFKALSKILSQELGILYLAPEIVREYEYDDNTKIMLAGFIDSSND